MPPMPYAAAAPPPGGGARTRRAPPGSPVPAPVINPQDQQRWRDDQVGRHVYHVYSQRWEAWNAFMRQNPEVIRRLDNGVIPPHSRDYADWELFAQAWVELQFSKQGARMIGATEQSIIDAEKSADNREVWTYV